ncbi:uncharacterized protein LOC62_01G000056 [Vanrija pseudolonga]|uniref:Tubby C-terminal domain-containing protein n=1 Tax=Vanrija pseudolonga TaxID=143232 RepID=A0AAF0XZ14_9TREE|nr:hypothetical protein LOC62_01G000056 [Vanrija pseudolonga]
MPAYTPHQTELAAPSTPVGLFPPLDGPTTLYFRDKIFKTSDTDTAVRDEDGAIVLRVLDHAFDRRRRMDLTDPEGNVLVSLRCKLATWLGKVVAEDAEGKWLLDAESRGSWNGKHLAISYADYSGERRSLTLRSDRVGRKVDVLANDDVIMHLEHKMLGKEHLGKNTDSWYLFLAPGVDYVLATAVCLAYDMYKEQQAARRG